ncbi:MAG: hypothetical protein AAF799_47330 [Myxococcota bacterium]
MIVVAKHHGTIGWYDSAPEFWILDQKKWADAFIAAGHDVDATDFSERFDLPVVDETTATEFLARMTEFRVSQQRLGERLEKAAVTASGWFDIADHLPMLFVDFDAKKLWSLHPEQTSFVDHVPNGWASEYENFFEHVPAGSRYWVNATGDVLKRFLG